MAEFMADRIMQQADISVEKGQAKYRAYFVNTKKYAKYKADVDAILTIEGGIYAECIVSK